MAFPLIVLAFGSIFVGYLAKDMMIGLGTNFWGSALFMLPQNVVYLESEYIPQSIKMIPLLSGALGAVIAYTVNIQASYTTYGVKTSWLGRTLYTFFNKRWLFDKVYNDYLAHPSLSFGYEVSFKTLDKGAIEILGPYGIAHTMRQLVKQVSSIQSGFVYHYALIMLIGLTVLISFIGLWETVSFWIDARLLFVHAISFLFYSYYCRS